MGTDHEGFCGYWDWRRIRDLWPENNIRGCISTIQHTQKVDNIYKTNDWYTCNKKTIIDRDLAIDKPMTLPDDTIAEINMVEYEMRRILDFDETDHPFTTKNEKRGS